MRNIVIARSKLSCLLCTSRIWNVDIIFMQSTLKWISRALLSKLFDANDALFSVKTTTCKWARGIQVIDNRGLLAGCPNATFWLVNLNWLANKWSQHCRWPACISIRDRQSCIKRTLVAYSAWVQHFPPRWISSVTSHVCLISNATFRVSKRISTSSHHSNLDIQTHDYESSISTIIQPLAR